MEDMRKFMTQLNEAMETTGDQKFPGVTNLVRAWIVAIGPGGPDPRGYVKHLLKKLGRETMDQAEAMLSGMDTEELDSIVYNENADGEPIERAGPIAKVMEVLENTL